MMEISKNDSARAEWRRQWPVLVVLLLAFAAFAYQAVVFLFGVGMGEYITSDAAVPMLVAREIVAQGDLFPDSWYFANRDLWILSPHLLALPFALAGSTGLEALAAANALGLAAILAIVIACTRRLGIGLTSSVVGALCAFSLFSGFQRDYVYTQLSYGWQTGILFALVLCAWQTATSAENRAQQAMWRWLYVALVAAVVAQSPMRSTLYSIAPIALALMFHEVWRGTHRQVWALFLTTAVGTVVGVVLHRAIVSTVKMQVGLTAFSIRPWPEWDDATGLLFRHFDGVLGLDSFSADPRVNFLDFLAAARIAFILLAVVGLLIAIFRHREQPSGVSFAALILVGLWSVCLSLFIATSVGEAAHSLRYLLPPLLGTLAVGMSAYDNLWPQARIRRAIVWACFGTAFLGGAVANVHELRKQPVSTCGMPRPSCEISQFSDRTSIRRGYAGYWEAGVTTVATGGRVEVCPVHFVQGLVPFRWLSSDRCYEKRPPAEYREYFIAVPRDVVATLDDATAAVLATSTRREESESLIFYVFDGSAPGSEWRFKP